MARNSSQPWAVLTVAADYPGFQTRPVAAEVWMNGMLAIDETIAAHQPVTRAFKVDEAHPWLLLESRTSEGVTPADFGGDDPRELGLHLTLTFGPEAPPGVTVVPQTR